MRQAQEFLDGEGAAWLKRNKAKLKATKNDPVIDAIEKYGIKPKRVLEIGCADGWRLKRMEKIWGCYIRGVDPGCIKDTDVISRNVASKLPLINSTADVVIYGWCLYLCDPEDYFHIVAEGDRVLQDGGFLIIYDFYSIIPYKVPYKHKKGLFSHHYDFAQLWLGHSAYTIYGTTVQDTTSVVILKKNLKNAFSVEK